jgi:hypothetical protein
MENYALTIPVRISLGNSKLGRDLPNVNLPPIISCQPDVPCAKQGCYSLKSFRAYPNVRRARRHNWAVLQSNFDRYFREIGEFLSLKDPPYFRWHSDGDIPSQKYLNSMIELAKNYPRTNMLAFTKNYSLNLDRCPTNLSIIPSLWTNYGPHDKINRPKAWMLDHKNPDERISGHYFKCSGHCPGCWACWHIGELNRDVVFAKH